MNDTLEKTKNIKNELSIGAFLTLFFAVVLFFASTISQNMNTLTIISIIQTILGICIIRHRTKTIVSFPIIFYVLCYLFHCTYFILIITENITGNVHVFVTLPEAIQIKTLKVCLMFLFFYPLGCFFFREKKFKSTPPFLTLDQCEKTGILLTAVCLWPRLYVDFILFRAYLLGGYFNTFDVQINNYITIFANMFYFGVLLTIFGMHNKKRKALYVFLFALAIILFGMLSGRRGIKIVYLIALLFIYFKYVVKKKLKFSTILLCSVLCYLILAVVAAFGDMRDTGAFSFSLFFNSLKNNITKKLFVDQFSEFGYAAYTLGASVEYFPNNHHGYGTNYIASWLQIFPNIGGVLTGFSDKMSFVLKLPAMYQKALGGSVLGECFYNFGNFSFLAFMLLGYLISFFASNLDYSMKSNYLSYRGTLCLLILSPTILWVRSSFNEFPRVIIWYLIILIIIKNLFWRKKT